VKATARGALRERVMYGVMWADDEEPLVLYDSLSEARGVAELGDAELVHVQVFYGPYEVHGG
jgi:hypothetical protein